MNSLRFRLSKDKSIKQSAKMSELEDSETADSQSTSVTFGNIGSLSPTGAVRNLVTNDVEESASDMSQAVEESASHQDLSAAAVVDPYSALTAPLNSKSEPIDFDILKVNPNSKNLFIDVKAGRL